jgi:hypothetical protein
MPPHDAQAGTANSEKFEMIGVGHCQASKQTSWIGALVCCGADRTATKWRSPRPTTALPPAACPRIIEIGVLDLLKYTNSQMNQGAAQRAA